LFGVPTLASNAILVFRMCPMRFVLALLSIVALAYCLFMMLGFGPGDYIQQASDGSGVRALPLTLRSALVLQRLRELPWWRKVASLFTGELLWILWTGKAKTVENDEAADASDGEETTGSDVSSSATDNTRAQAAVDTDGDEPRALRQRR
jgi:hypothetical protein